MCVTEVDSLCSEVRRSKSILESHGQFTASELQDALANLRHLGQLPAKVLADTRIGFVVQSIAKTPMLAESVRASARALVDAWRQDFRKRSGSADGVAPCRRKTKRLSAEAAPQPSSGACRDGEVATVALHAFCTDGMSAAGTDEVISRLPTPHRDKVRQKLTEALRAALATAEASGAPTSGMCPASDLAIAIEEALYNQLMPQSGIRYLRQAKSLIFNVKDEANEAFRLKILFGSVNPADLARMTAEEMASDARHAERAFVRREALEAAMKSEPQGEFSCEKCGGTLCRRTLGEVR